MFAKEFLLKKDYELLTRIGEGTYATVYKARRLSDSQMVAVKIINVFKMDRKKIENALNEVRIICAIDHPNVVGYHEAFLDDTNKDLYIVMEYVGGGDLNDRIRMLKQQKNFLKEGILWKYAIQILQGLKALHDRKIIHRDIKPGNIFVSEDLLTLKIGDLNVSKIMRNKVMTATVIGTPYYLAPEIWKNAMYDYRCDVFSFGCVLYEVAALKVPFQGASIAELFKKIEYGKIPSLPNQYSPQFFDFLKKCMIKKMKQRPTVERLLKSPILTKKKAQFQEVVYDDRKDKKRILGHMKVNDLTKLKKILPSLKSMRSNSVKMLSVAEHSFERKMHSGREWTLGSKLNKSRGYESMSVKSRLRSSVKKEKFVSKNARAKKSVKGRAKQSKSKSIEARKNYFKFLKEQRRRREQIEAAEPKWKLLAKQETIEEEGELVGTLEMEREPKPNILEANPIEIKDSLKNKKGLSKPPLKGNKRESSSQRSGSRKFGENRYASQVSVRTNKTNKKVLRRESISGSGVAPDKRTLNKDKPSMKGNKAKAKQDLKEQISRSASRIKGEVKAEKPRMMNIKHDSKRISLIETRKYGLLENSEVMITESSIFLKESDQMTEKNNFVSNQNQTKKRKNTLISERKIIKKKFSQNNSQRNIYKNNLNNLKNKKKRKSKREEIKKIPTKKSKKGFFDSKQNNSKKYETKTQNTSKFKRFANKTKTKKKPLTSKVRDPKNESLQKINLNYSEKKIKLKQSAKNSKVNNNLGVKKNEKRIQLHKTNKIKLTPLKTLDEISTHEEKVLSVNIHSPKVNKIIPFSTNPDLDLIDAEMEDMNVYKRKSVHERNFKTNQSYAKKQPLLPVSSKTNKFKRKCQKIPNRTVISSYSCHSQIKRKMNSVTQGLRPRTKHKLYKPSFKKKRISTPPKVKSYIECPSNSEIQQKNKTTRTMTSIAPMKKETDLSDYSDLAFTGEIPNASIYSKHGTPVKEFDLLSKKADNYFETKNLKRPFTFNEDNTNKSKLEKVKEPKIQKIGVKKHKAVKNVKKSKKLKVLKPMVNKSKVEKKGIKKSKRNSTRKSGVIKSKNFRTGVLKMPKRGSNFGSTRMAGSQRFI